MANSILSIIAAFYHHKSPTRHRTHQMQSSIRVSNAFVKLPAIGRKREKLMFLWFWRKFVRPESVRCPENQTTNIYFHSSSLESNVINVSPRVAVMFPPPTKRGTGASPLCATFVNLFFFFADTHASFLAFFVLSGKKHSNHIIDRVVRIAIIGSRWRKISSPAKVFIVLRIWWRCYFGHVHTCKSMLPKKKTIFRSIKISPWCVFYRGCGI